MSHWRATSALARSLLVAASGLAFAVVFGDPVLVVLATPFLLCAGLGLLHRPRTEPRVTTRLDHQVLHEGQGTVCHLVVTGDSDVEHVTRVSARTPYVALRPPSGTVGALVRPGVEVAGIEVSPRRWGKRLLGEEKVGLTTRWGGYRWGPELLVGSHLVALPATAPFDSRAEMPAPMGLVGAHRSRRVGDGTEFSGIRPFHAGDRLRRVQWRVSLRTGSLHVVETRAEEDSAVLVVVDALADYGRSGGIDGDSSSLDVAVRGAAALAEHHTRAGDRVSLRVVGGTGQVVRLGAGSRHLRMILGRLAEVRAAVPRDVAGALDLRVTAGTVVIILSPMLDELMVGAAAGLMRRGVPVLVIDSLPVTAGPTARAGVRAELADLAWRMRRLERDLLLDQLAGTGCPVVAWRGPGTLDEVLRRLARRAQLPQVSSR